MEIIRKYGDGILVITPSDAFIKDTDEFTRILGIAVEAAQKGDKLVTVGITPTFPATGYGYIKYDDSVQADAKPVSEFKEKPDLQTAGQYVASGNYVWNSGMFIWKASVILKNFEKFLPDIYEAVTKLGEAMNTDLEQVALDEIYPQIRNISIDYGIMEQSQDVLVVPGEFGWNDVGSFDMLKVMHEEDDNGNVVVGNCVNIDTTNSVVYSDTRLVTTLGVDNIVVVETADGIMVCSKDRVQDVKKIVDRLKQEGMNQYL
jgi:mannose-1-phosphate guanylyltransferase